VIRGGRNTAAGIAKRLCATAAAANALILVASCSRDTAVASNRELRVKEIGDTSVVTVPHAERFPLVAVRSDATPDRLRVTCVVTPDVRRTVPLNALGGGRVVELRAKLGDDVVKGETLVVISSPDVSGALSDHQKARTNESLARQQLERAKLLFEHGTIARKDLEVAENAEQNALVDVRTTLERVRMLGGDPLRLSPYIELKAPISGTVIEQNVTSSAGVKSPDNAPNLLTIADLSHVWVMCDVYENDLARVQIGQRAEVRLNAYPDRLLVGSIGNVSKILDPNTRTAKVRVELDNSAGSMRQGMFATVDLISRQARSFPVLPQSALFRLHDADWVFKKTGLNTFRRLQVLTGGSASDSLQTIIGGVAPGDQVVRNALEFSRAIEQQ